MEDAEFDRRIAEIDRLMDSADAAEAAYRAVPRFSLRGRWWFWRWGRRLAAGRRALDRLKAHLP